MNTPKGTQSLNQREAGKPKTQPKKVELHNYRIRMKEHNVVKTLGQVPDMQDLERQDCLQEKTSCSTQEDRNLPFPTLGIQGKKV